MSEDSSPQTPMATWNPARGVWETTAVSLFCGHSEPYSQTWPASGSMRNGRSFERPKSVPPTSANEPSSSPGLPTPRARDSRGRGYEDGLPNVAMALLKTPTAQLAVNGGSQHPDKRKAGGHGPTLADEVEHLLPTPRAARGASATETVALLPTPGPSGGDREASTYSRNNPTLKGALLPAPRASDGEKGGPNQRGSKGDLALPAAVVHLLPTPKANDCKGTRTSQRAKDLYGSGPTLTDAVTLLPTGVGSPQPSADGNTPPADVPPGQLTIDTA